MKNKNIFLHIGLPKTGTTSIQNTLQHMQDNGFLAKKDFQYHNSDNIFRMILEKNFFPNDVKNFTEKLYLELRSYTANGEEDIKNNIILSQEAFSMEFVDNNLMVSTNRIHNFYSVLKNFNVKIVIYLRRQDIFLESLYAQWAKSGRLNKDKIEKKELKKSLFYKKHLDDCASLFGKENIIVRIFEKNFLINGDVVSDFLQIVGLKNITLPDISQREKNYSLSPEALRIRLAFDEKFRLSVEEKQNYLDELNEKYLNAEIDKFCYVSRKFFILNDQNVEMVQRYSNLQQLLCLEKVGSFSNTGFMNPDERREFLAHYEEDNTAIAREYLDREDGRLFNDVFPENIISLNEPNTTDLVAIFVPIFNDLNLRLQRAEDNLKTVETRLKYIKHPFKYILKVIKKLLKR